MSTQHEEKIKKITFFANSPTLCPICAEKFFREELHSGGGRLIAGKLTDELRRLYEPSVKFGEINPLIYPVIVCPACYYAAFPEDFGKIERDGIAALEGRTADRRKSIALLFPHLDFKQPRGLKEGIASCYLGMACYDFFKTYFMPTVKRGILSLRAAWMLEDLHRKAPDENYDYAARVFYRKALFYYRMAIERDQKGEEAMAGKGNLGPDTDKNYGYDGVLYLSGYLEYKYGSKKDPALRQKTLEYVKRLFAKIFGIGKSSKNKPSPILEKAKDIYSSIGDEIKQLSGAGE
ncbi:MAG TPA: DUF2225 domain-containing protein [Spirochaetia bacterium]|nr:DUF2225 domain-containing protein [Spirochaetia bacterium]